MADGKITIDTKISQKGAEKGVKELQSKLERTGKKAKSVGTKASKMITLPLAGLGAAAVKIGADFDDAMAHVQAVTGATTDEMQSMEDMAKKLGETTEFSASEAAEGMGFLGQAGYETNEILASMPGLLDLATAGELDLGNAADIASNVMSGFNLEAEDTGRISDVLAKGAASANTSVQQMGDAMSYVAPVAQGAGISLEETSAAVGILSDAGIQGQRAGTALRSTISSLQNPTGQTKEALEEMGLSMEDVDPSANSLSEILGTLQDAGIDSADAMKLAGNEAGPGLIALLEEGEEGLANFTSDMEGAEGSAEEMADTMRDTTSGGFKELLSSLESLGLTIYDELKPAIQTITEFLTKLTRKFSDMNPVARKVIVVVGALAIAIPPLVAALGALAIAMGAVSAPVLIIVGVIAALIAIVAVLVIKWDEIKEATINIWNSIKEFFISWWEETKERFMTMINLIKEVLSTAWNWIKETTMTVWNAIKNLISSVWEGIKSAVTSSINAVKSIITSIWNAIKSVTSSVWNGIKSAVMGIWNAIKSTASTVFNGVKSVITGVWNTIKSVSSTVWNGIKGTISGIIDGISSTVSDVFNSIKDTVTGVWDTISSKTSDIWDGITDSIKGAINAVIGAINGMIDGLNKIHIKTPKIPDWVPKYGGKGFDIGFDIPNIPTLDVGTNFVASDGLAMLHQGEAVVPKEYNPAADGNNGGVYEFNIEIPIDGETVAKKTVRFTSQELEKLNKNKARSKGVVY